MKKSKKNSNNDLVTKKYLDKTLDERFSKNTSEILEYVDLRFKAIDERFEEVDRRFEEVDRRFDKIDQKLDSIIKTLDWLVKSYQDLKDENVIRYEHYRRLDNRVTALEKRVFAA